MIKRQLQFGLLLVASIIFVVSCIKDEDLNFDKIVVELNDWNLAAPLVSGDLTINDFISEEMINGTEIKIDTTGNIYTVSYEHQETMSFDVNIPPLSLPRQLSKKGITQQISETIDIGFFDNSMLAGIGLEKVMALVQLSSQQNFKGTLRNIKLTGIDKSGNPIPEPFYVTPSLSIDLGPTKPPVNVIDNFNLANAINTKPAKIVFSAELEIDSDIDPNIRRIDLNILGNIAMQMSGWVQEMVMDTESDFSLGIDQTDLLDNSSATLKYQFENSFPFGSDIQLYFLKNNTILDSLFIRNSNDYLVPAANPKNNTNGKTSGTITVTNTRLENISKANKTLIQAKFETFDAKNKEIVNIRPSQKLNVKLWGRVSLNGTFDLDSLSF